MNRRIILYRQIEQKFYILHRMVRIEAGIFDVGGVLITNEMAHVREDIKTELGLTDDVFRSAWRAASPDLGNGKISEEEFWKRFIEISGTTKTIPPGESLLLRQYTKRFNPIQEVINILPNLKTQGLKLAILSNTIEPHVNFLEKKGLFTGFDVKVFSNGVGISKPNPRIYTLTLEKLGLQNPETVFMIDDDTDNIEAAKNLGIIGILFTNPSQLKTDLHNLGVLD